MMIWIAFLSFMPIILDVYSALIQWNARRFPPDRLFGVHITTQGAGGGMPGSSIEDTF